MAVGSLTRSTLHGVAPWFFARTLAFREVTVSSMFWPLWLAALRDIETDGEITGPTNACPPRDDPDLGLNDFPR
jgi:hypothetical protein